MSTIEVIVSNLRAAMRAREIGVLWPLVEPISRAERLAQGFFSLPLFPRPDGIGEAYDDLRDVLADLKIDESFGEAAAQEAAVKITALNAELERFLRQALGGDVPMPREWVEAAQAVPRPPTKAQEEAALGAKGFSGPLLEVLVKAGAAKRHAARVEYVKAAAVAACTAAGAANPQGIAALILHADAAGVGGTADIEGLGTARPTLLSLLCGSGRKQAQDGAAWSAAIAQAAAELCQDYITGQVVYHPGVEALGAYDPVRADWVQIHALPEETAAQLIGPRYLRAAALRAAMTPPGEGLLPHGSMLSAAFQWADEAQKEQRARAEARAILGW